MTSKILTDKVSRDRKPAFTSSSPECATLVPPAVLSSTTASGSDAELSARRVSALSVPSPLTLERLGIPQDENVDEDKNGRTENPINDDCAWTFLESLNMSKMRTICKEFAIKQRGSMEKVMKRLFMALKRAPGISNGTWTVNSVQRARIRLGIPERHLRAFGDLLEDNKHREHWKNVPE